MIIEKTVYDAPIEDRFAPYTVDYVTSLMAMLSDDVQDNRPKFDGEYLSIALKACRNLNKMLGDSCFDLAE